MRNFTPGWASATSVNNAATATNPVSLPFDCDAVLLTNTSLTARTHVMMTYYPDGIIDDGIHATLTVNPAGTNNALVFTAVTGGVGGNSITIEYVDPAAPDAVLSVGVVGTAITVNLATDGGSVITTTAAEIIDAIEASGAASALVTVANSGSDDGSGVVAAVALTPLAGGAPTGTAPTTSTGVPVLPNSRIIVQLPVGAKVVRTIATAADGAILINPGKSGY